MGKTIRPHRQETRHRWVDALSTGADIALLTEDFNVAHGSDWLQRFGVRFRPEQVFPSHGSGENDVSRFLPCTERNLTSPRLFISEPV
jgi:hypothetical protein